MDEPAKLIFHLKKGAKPVSVKNRVFPKPMQDFLNKEVARLKEMGVIQRSDSLHNVSPCIATKSNGDFRFTLNLIPINE